MVQSREKLVTGGQTDDSDFIGRGPTKVERLKEKEREDYIKFILKYNRMLKC